MRDSIFLWSFHVILSLASCIIKLFDDHTQKCFIVEFIMLQSLAAAAKRLIPMFDRVLVLRAEAVTKTKGGIVIPEKSQGKVLHGTVVAVGPGSRNSVSKFI